jgi:hypothetical protein
MELGYGFCWNPHEAPTLTTPKGAVYVLEVEDFVPVLVNVAADPIKEEGPATAAEPPSTTSIHAEHYLTHTPKDLRCPHCVEAKLTAKPARRRVPDGEHPLDLPSKFGELLVTDHIILGKEVEQSLHGDSVVCVVTDVGTGWVMAYPAKTKTANAVKRAFMHFAGTEDNIARLYCDNAKELEKAAAAQLEWRVDTSTPYRHTSNGVAERSNRRVIDGARTLLHASGLPHCFWGYACQCFCTLRNGHDENRHSKSAYENRHGAPFQGMLIPFGAVITYRPPPGKEGLDLLKFEPRIRKGIFMGYHFHSGGRWSGDYIVLDCETPWQSHLGYAILSGSRK